MPSNQRPEGKPEMNRRGFLTATAGSAVATAIVTASAVKAGSLTSEAEESSSMTRPRDARTVASTCAIFSYLPVPPRPPC